uniref:Flocculation protein FLO11-like n=1 Tax=Caenorhabditis tropicalis TaxID=1561998 RepID=A0A1I7TI30_9PELO
MVRFQIDLLSSSFNNRDKMSSPTTPSKMSFSSGFRAPPPSFPERKPGTAIAPTVDASIPVSDQTTPVVETANLVVDSTTNAVNAMVPEAPGLTLKLTRKGGNYKSLRTRWTKKRISKQAINVEENQLPDQGSSRGFNRVLINPVLEDFKYSSMTPYTPFVPKLARTDEQVLADIKNGKKHN